MPTLSNSFEGGTNATTITTGNSGGTSGTAFDAVTISGSNTLTYSTTSPARGTLGMAVAIPGSSGNPAYATWAGSLITDQVGGTTATTYGRVYLKLPAIPNPGGTGATLMRAMNSAGSAQRWSVRLNSSGQIQVADGTNTVIATSTTTLTSGTVWRIEVGGEGKASGTIECRIYLGHSITPTETIGPLTAQNLGGSIFSLRFGIGASLAPATSQTWYLDDLGASTTTWPGPSVSVPNVTHTWVGAVTPTGATVSYGLVNTVNGQLIVSTASDLSTVAASSSSTAVDGNGVVKLAVTGLTADTPYFYGVKCDGTLISVGRGSFRTDPTAGSQSSFSVLFGSCMQTNSNAVTFATMAAMSGPFGKPRRFIHEGDLHYRDFGSSNTLADIVAQYQSSLAAGNFASLISQVPTTYTWDNHDWGGVDSNATTPRAADLKTAYGEYVPSYPLADLSQVGPTGAIYQSWVIGRVRFIDLDTRSERSNRTDTESSSKNMLGAQQEAWLYSELLQPEPVKIIVSGIYWRSDAVNGDRWGSYSTQWNRIKAWFTAHPSVQAYVVFGDRHALAADDGTSAGCYLPQAGGAPMDQGSTASSEAWTAGYYDTGGSNLKGFGWLDITDGGSSITLAYTGYTSDSTPRVTMSTTFTVAGSGGGLWGVHI
jgi:hypothetical protein